MHRHLRLLLVAVVFAAVAVIPSAASAAENPFDLYWDNAPQGWTASDTADFAINADSVDANDLDYTCSLDGAVASSCTRNNTFGPLGDGAHSFTQTATNGEATEALTFEWFIDDGIGAYFYSKPSKLSNSRWAWFGWFTTGVVDHVECKFDDADWATCGDGWINQHLGSDGEHSFSIQAVDDEGNAQVSPTTYAWTIDTVAPVVTTNLPTVITSADFDLVISSDSPDTQFECSLNGDDADCDDIDVSDFLIGESNRIQIWATDPAGNQDYYSKEFGYQVGASVAQITAHPARIKPTNGTSTFEFTSDPGATFECRYLDDDFAPCTSPMTVNEWWFDDHYTFEVRAVNNDVTQNVATRFDWYAGDEPFNLYFDSTPGGWTSETSAQFSVYADDWDNDDIAYTCSLDDSAFAACEYEFEYEDLAPGVHELRVQATSNTEGGFEELTYEWRISDLPGAWFDGKPNKFTSNTSANFYWSSNNANEWDCKLDDADWSDCGSDYYKSFDDLLEGEHTFQVRARSDEILQDPVASYTWTIDQTNPVVTASVPSTITTDPYTIPVSASEEGVKLYCAIDDGDEFRCDDGVELSGLTRGFHTIWTWGEDRAGNWSDTEAYAFDWQPAAPSAPVAPPTTPAAPIAPIVKPTLNKPTKPKNGKFTVPYSCGDSICTVTVKFKLGKKSQSMKMFGVKQGAGKAQLKLSKAQQKWLGKKGKKKATMTVTITGAAGSASQTLKF